jgi:hypothetical protein
MPVGYASRFLSKAEINLISKLSAFSSMIGEAIAVHFGLTYFYPELSSLTAGFEVICDCKNLTYWKTSLSPVLVSLRSSISGRYDLFKIRLRHIRRVNNFTADSIARMTSSTPHETFQEIMCSTYEYPSLAQDVLSEDNAPGSISSFADVPDGFPASSFSADELAMLRTDKSSASHIVGAHPVTRVIHGRPIYVVPRAEIKATFDLAHVDEIRRSLAC